MSPTQRVSPTSALPQERIRKWLEKGLRRNPADEFPNRVKELAMRLNKHDSTVYKMLGLAGKDIRRIRVDELAICALVVKSKPPCRVPLLANVRPVANTIAVAAHFGEANAALYVAAVEHGHVRAGKLVAKKIGRVSATRAAPRVIEIDSKYPHARHLSFVVDGVSMTEAKIFDGDIIVCVDFADVGGPVPNQKPVVVEQGKLRAIRIAHVFPDRVEFRSATGDAALDRAGTIVVRQKDMAKADIRVIALVRRVIREF